MDMLDNTQDSFKDIELSHVKVPTSCFVFLLDKVKDL